MKRRAEAKWKKTGLHVHKELFLFHKKRFRRMIHQAKRNYFLEKFETINDSKTFFQITNTLLGKQKSCQSPLVSSTNACEDLSAYFVNKIVDIRNELDKTNLQPAYEKFEGSPLTSFQPISIDETESIMSCKTKSCELDPIPTSLLKQCKNELVPYITEMVNHSLMSGTLDPIFKIAQVTPILKKTGLNEQDPKNYRPVSNLPFISKVIEKVVLKQLTSHLSTNNLNEDFQSAYKAGHSTETALLRIANDLLQILDSGSTTVLTLLDLSAAFDTIDHHIIFRRLEITYGISGTALDWFVSYLTGRRQYVSIGDSSSTTRQLCCGVPQGSVLGPVLFVLYTSPVTEIIRNHDLNYHVYADDTQIYSTNSTMDLSQKISTTETCINDVSIWMSANKLKLNETKTEVIYIRGNGNKTSMPHLNIGGNKIEACSKAKNLGVTLDTCLSMTCQISNTRKNLIFVLKNIAHIRPFLTQNATEKLILSLIFSKIDYCNSLYFGTTSSNIQRLQSIQNNAARLVVNKKGRQHEARPILKELHWLPIEQRIEYKAATLVFKCLNGTAPEYLQSLVSVRRPSRSLRSSADTTALDIPRSRLRTGERSFQFFGPKVWNSLPPSLRASPTIGIFKRHLKTFLFCKAFPDV